MDIFARATRKALRYSTPKGLLSVEQLWDLSLKTTSANGTSLDLIAIDLDKQLQGSSTKSFVDEGATNSEAEIIKLKFDIVKMIIDVKLAENKTAREAAAKKQKREEVMKLIEEKDGEALRSKSKAELEAMLSEL